MFIAFEGLDGSGSSTQAKLLKEYLEKEGKKVILTKEPTDSEPLGVLIRDALQHKYSFSPTALQLLFCADRAEHFKSIIQPALEKNEIVITDRYLFSTLAYGSLNCDFDWLTALNRPFPNPDVTFLLKLEPEICLQRIASRGSKTELFEKKETLKKVWEGYEKVASQYLNIVIIDASQAIEDIAKEISYWVKSSLESKDNKLNNCYQKDINNL